MGRKQQKKVDSWKEKKWYSIVAPEFLNRAVVGQTIASDPNRHHTKFNQNQLSPVLKLKHMHRHT
jgi:ribosomal protein S3AE